LAVVLRFTAAPRTCSDTAALCSSILQPQKQYYGIRSISNTSACLALLSWKNCD
jgi:hypothetical protein